VVLPTLDVLTPLAPSTTSRVVLRVATKVVARVATTSRVVLLVSSRTTTTAAKTCVVKISPS